MQMLGQCRSLMNHVQRGMREINRQKNLVEDNLASLRILSQAINQQDAAVEAAARSLQEPTVRYKVGVDPHLNVSVAQNDSLAMTQFGECRVNDKK